VVQQLIETQNQSFVKLDKTWKEHKNFNSYFLLRHKTQDQKNPTNNNWPMKLGYLAFSTSILGSQNLQVG
jgi:hypothetical protein